MKTKLQTKKLGEICEIRPPKSEVKKKLNDKDLVSFVPMEDLGIFCKDFKPKHERQLKDVQGSYTYFADGDVLLAKITPCFENGKIGIARGLKSGIGFGSSEFIVFRSKGEVLSDYLYYILTSDYFRDRGIKLMSGAVGHKRVPKEYIEEFEILVPSLSEQKRIVKILDEAFEKIERAKENAEKNLQNSKELFEYYLQDTFSNTKNGWEVKKLGEVAEYFNGLTYSPKNVSDEGIIVLRSSNVQNDELDFSDIVRVNCKVKEKVIVKEEDILMCSRNGSKRLVGKTATIKNLKEPMTFGTFMMIVRGKNNSYLAWFFKSTEFRRQIAGGENTMINQITRYMLDDIVVSFPPQKELNVIVKKLDLLSEQTKKLEGIYKKKLADLEELKKSVLNKAFTGEL